MMKVLAIVWQDVRVFLSDKSNLPSLLVTPAVMTVIIALVSGGAFGGPGVSRLDVVDLDRSSVSAQLLDSIRRANPGLTLCPFDNDSGDVCQTGKADTLTEPQALERVANSTSLAVLVIPDGLGAAVDSNQPTQVIFRSTSAFGTAQAAQQAVESVVSQVNGAAAAASVGASVAGQLDPALAPQAAPLRDAIYQKALRSLASNPIGVDFGLSGSHGGQSFTESLRQGLGQSVPGMGTMFVLMTVFGGMAALIVEKEQGTMQRLGVMPVARSTLLAGKILARFCLGLIQFLVVFVVGAVLGMDFGKDPLALLLVVIVYTLSVTALSFALGSRLKTPAQASGLSLLLTLTLAPLGGAWWPLEISPRFMQIAGHVSPVAWAMEAFTKLTYQGAGLGDIWGQLLVLAGFTVVAFILAIPRFTYTLD
jgi:ABC-2 type transport system permease protein